MTKLIEYLTVLLEYLDLLQTRWQGTANIWEGLGPAKYAFWLCVSHILTILVSDYSCFMLVHGL